MENEIKKSSHILELVIMGLVIFIVIVSFFAAGVLVGQERARFSFEWAENYHTNFGGPKMGFMGNMMQQDFINGHGVVGLVIGIDDDVILIKSQDNVEKDILVLPGATIRNAIGAVDIAEIKIGDQVVIIGAPNGRGQIEAQFIRIMPSVTPATFLKIKKGAVL